MTTVSVISLPRGDMRVLPVSFGELGYNGGTFGTVAGMAETIMSARPEPALPPLGIDGQHVGVPVDHPARQGGCWCAQHHPQADSAKNRDGIVKPAKFILTRLRFKTRPSKFSDPYPC